MKKAMLCFALILHGVALALAQPDAASAWLSGIKTQYPDRDYISADGQGPSYEDAEKQALVRMAGYFHTTVEAFNETVAAYSELNGNGKTDALSATNITIRNRTESKEDFLGMRVRQERFHTSAGEWVAVFAYIDRKDAEKQYRSRIETNMIGIDALMSEVSQSDDQFESFKVLSKGMGLADMTKKYIENLSLLNPGKSQEYLQAYAPYLNTIQQLYSEHKRLQNAKVNAAVEFRGSTPIGEAEKSMLRQAVQEALGRYNVPVQMRVDPVPAAAGRNRYAFVITLDSRANASGLVIGNAAINFARDGETLSIVSPVEKITELDTGQFVQRAVKYIRDNRVFYQAIITEINR
jgi:hypothetical protein